MNAADRYAIYQRDGGLCGFCGMAVPFEAMHLDHIRPVGLGGSDNHANLRPAHRLCNIAAGQDVIRERRRLGLPRSARTATAINGVTREQWRELRAASVRLGVPIGALLSDILREWFARELERLDRETPSPDPT